MKNSRMKKRMRKQKPKMLKRREGSGWEILHFVQCVLPGFVRWNDSRSAGLDAHDCDRLSPPSPSFHSSLFPFVSLLLNVSRISRSFFRVRRVMYGSEKGRFFFASIDPVSSPLWFDWVELVSIRGCTFCVCNVGNARLIDCFGCFWIEARKFCFFTASWILVTGKLSLSANISSPNRLVFFIDWAFTFTSRRKNRVQVHARARVCAGPFSLFAGGRASSRLIPVDMKQSLLVRLKSDKLAPNRKMRL